MNLNKFLKEGEKDIQKIALEFDDIVKKAADILNKDFSIRRLSKGTRENEPLPTEQRQLSSYRTRIGTMLEYALSTEIDKMLRELNGDDYYFTFAVSHEYPDFYLRDNTLTSMLRIEMKAVDAESDEQAARFGTATADIEGSNDLLLIVGWEWQPFPPDEPIGEYPHIFKTLVIPAADIVEERDKRLKISGGKIEGNKVYVPKRGKPGEFSLDPGNYGKFWRLIHKSRRDADDLSPSVKRFLEFLKEIDEHSPNNRF